MDFWTLSHKTILKAAEKHYGKRATKVIPQSGLYASVEFSDGSIENVYTWMI